MSIVGGLDSFCLIVKFLSLVLADSCTVSRGFSWGICVGNDFGGGSRSSNVVRLSSCLKLFFKEYCLFKFVIENENLVTWCDGGQLLSLVSVSNFLKKS